MLVVVAVMEGRGTVGWGAFIGLRVMVRVEAEVEAVAVIFEADVDGRRGCGGWGSLGRVYWRS